jgi:hypothetical protein
LPTIRKTALTVVLTRYGRIPSCWLVVEAAGDELRGGRFANGGIVEGDQHKLALTGSKSLGMSESGPPPRSLSYVWTGYQALGDALPPRRRLFSV